MLALLIWAFAVYGAWVALVEIYRLISARATLEKRLTLVLLLCNGERYIEGLLRVIAYKAFLSKRDLRVVVIDTGSQDATLEIVRRLQEKDPRIELVETNVEFHTELLMHLWGDTGQDSPFVLFDLRGWNSPKKIIPGLTRIVG